MEESLLAPIERSPFCHTSLVDYGDVTVGEEVWDIEGLLKAQLAKCNPEQIRKEERERIKKFGYYIENDSEMLAEKGDFIIRRAVVRHALREGGVDD